MPTKKRTPKKPEMFASTPKQMNPPKRFEPLPKRSGRPYLIVIIVIAMALSAAYLLIKGVNVAREPEPAPRQAPVEEQEARQEYLDSIVDSVKKHIIVNEDEEPYVATIGNIDLLRQENPAFYKNASEGDKLVAWSDKAVIYSERLDKIVAVATALPPELTGSTSTAAMEEPEEEAAPEEMLAEDVRIEIRNGSRIAGAASRLRTTLLGEGLTISSISDAAQTYDGTRIIDLTGGQADGVIRTVSGITEGAVTSTVPEGEPASEANILVLIGR
jgi:hypothetical protein